MNNLKNLIKRGYVIQVDFGTQVGSVQSKKRPAVVIQNDIGNKYSPNTIVVPLTSKHKKSMPTHFKLDKEKYDYLHTDSLAICEQIITISKGQIKECLGYIDKDDIVQIEKRLAISMGLTLVV